MVGMEHDRFDDVEVRFLHDPDVPPEPPRRRSRWVGAVVAAAILTGGFAAAASAGGGERSATSPAGEQGLKLVSPESSRSHMRNGKPCRRGEPYGGHRSDGDSSDLRY
jgi:hypothetical protein